MKICPLIVASYRMTQMMECKADDCAWYDGKQCAILSIMKALESIAQGVMKR